MLVREVGNSGGVYHQVDHSDLGEGSRRVYEEARRFIQDESQED